MRRDEAARLREQKKHIVVQLRSLGGRYDDGRPWAREDAERRDHLLTQVQTISDKLAENHERELNEIRQATGAGSSAGFKAAGYERSHAPEPLYQAFRSAGFARKEKAEIPWETWYRAVTWTGSVDNLDSPRRNAGYLGYDQRYAYAALPSVDVDSGVTSVSLLTQTARTLATPANVVRAIDAVTAKPETAENADRIDRQPQAARLGRLRHPQRVPRKRAGRVDHRERSQAGDHGRARRPGTCWRSQPPASRLREPIPCS